ncbi:hypothetical protein EV426DRAFT_719904 [Tirmania nivea]|nr:hypothetical protein EV426DRAFT_719904 [Tirmania nivea]
MEGNVQIEEVVVKTSHGNKFTAALPSEEGDPDSQELDKDENIGLDGKGEEHKEEGSDIDLDELKRSDYGRQLRSGKAGQCFLEEERGNRGFDEGDEMNKEAGKRGTARTHDLKRVVMRRRMVWQRKAHGEDVQVITEGGVRQWYKEKRTGERSVKGFGMGRVVKWHRKAVVNYTRCRSGKGDFAVWKQILGKHDGDISCRGRGVGTQRRFGSVVRGSSWEGGLVVGKRLTICLEYGRKSGGEGSLSPSTWLSPSLVD